MYILVVEIIKQKVKDQSLDVILCQRLESFTAGLIISIYKRPDFNKPRASHMDNNISSVGSDKLGNKIIQIWYKRLLWANLSLFTRTGKGRQETEENQRTDSAPTLTLEVVLMFTLHSACTNVHKMYKPKLYNWLVD